MVKLYFLFSFVWRECLLALGTKCVIVGDFHSGACLQNRRRAVHSCLFPFCFRAADWAQNMGQSLRAESWAAPGRCSQCELPGVSPFARRRRAAACHVGQEEQQQGGERQTRDILEGKVGSTKLWWYQRSREIVLSRKTVQDRWQLKSLWVQKYPFSTSL